MSELDGERLRCCGAFLLGKHSRLEPQRTQGCTGYVNIPTLSQSAREGWGTLGVCLAPLGVSLGIDNHENYRDVARRFAPDCGSVFAGFASGDGGKETTDFGAAFHL